MRRLNLKSNSIENGPIKIMLKGRESRKHFIILQIVGAYLLIVYFRGNHDLLFECRSPDRSWNNSAETFRSSNDRSKINDCVNHSVYNELMKNPASVQCTQLIGVLQKYICVNALPGCGELLPFLRETCFTTLFPLASDNVPVSQWLDAMWELWGGLLLVVLGSLCGIQLCVFALLNRGSLIT